MPHRWTLNGTVNACSQGGSNYLTLKTLSLFPHRWYTSSGPYLPQLMLRIIHYIPQNVMVVLVVFCCYRKDRHLLAYWSRKRSSKLRIPEASIPQSQWCISTYFRYIPLFLVYFRVWEKFSNFSKKCMFHPPKFLITFFNNWFWICKFHLFSQNATFPYFGKFIFSLLFSKFPLISFNLRVFCLGYFTCFRFP